MSGEGAMPLAGANPGWLSMRRRSIIPGFGLAMGVTLFCLGLIVLLPLGALLLRATSLGWSGFWAIAFDPRTLGALKLSFGTAFVAGLINAVFGVLIAWVFTRYNFPGRRFFDALIDLPFALPTAVAGIALTVLYAPNGVVGAFLARLGIKVAFTPSGIVLALVFVGLPFVVRTVQPILEELDREVEEASATLGATRLQTVLHIILPCLAPAVLTGFALAVARGIGEYGSVIFIAGNIPYVSEIAPLLVVVRLEEFDYAGATVLATLMLALSFGMLLFLNLMQGWSRRRYGHG